MFFHSFLQFASKEIIFIHIKNIYNANITKTQLQCRLQCTNTEHHLENDVYLWEPDFYQDNKYCKHRTNPQGSEGEIKKASRSHTQYETNNKYLKSTNFQEKKNLPYSEQKSVSEFSQFYSGNRETCICKSKNIQPSQYNSIKLYESRKDFSNPSVAAGQRSISFGKEYSGQKRHAADIMDTSLMEGSRMKEILNESENPEAVIKKTLVGKDYDQEYEIMEKRIRKVKAHVPQVSSKIGNIIKHDRSLNL